MTVSCMYAKYRHLQSQQCAASEWLIQADCLILEPFKRLVRCTKTLYVRLQLIGTLLSPRLIRFAPEARSTNSMDAYPLNGKQLERLFSYKKPTAVILKCWAKCSHFGARKYPTDVGLELAYGCRHNKPSEPTLALGNGRRAEWKWTHADTCEHFVNFIGFAVPSARRLSGHWKWWLVDYETKKRYGDSPIYRGAVAKMKPEMPFARLALASELAT